MNPPTMVSPATVKTVDVDVLPLIVTTFPPVVTRRYTSLGVVNKVSSAKVWENKTKEL